MFTSAPCFYAGGNLLLIMKQLLLLGGLLGLLWACETPTQEAKSKVYYNVEGFVKGQIEALTKSKPTVHKTMLLKTETRQQTTNAINWTHELELFLQADINKPAFRNSYTIKRPDSLTYQYTLKAEEEKLTVRALTIQLDAVTQQPRRIDALLKTKNLLYESERHVALEGGLAKDQTWRINAYQITGFQQLRFFDRNDFSIEATLQ